jgi:hypothetical protein
MKMYLEKIIKSHGIKLHNTDIYDSETEDDLDELMSMQQKG